MAVSAVEQRLVVTGGRTPSRVGDHAVIGDGRSAALVARDGTIDWLCWPRFDSPPLFAALLEAESGGFWRVTPRAPGRVRRAYLGDSNVLVTTFESASGRCRLVDLMPVYPEETRHRRLIAGHELLRLLECEDGEVECEVRFQPRLDDGRRAPRLRAAGTLGLRVEDGARLYTLRSDAELTVRDGAAEGLVRLRAGEGRRFSLTYDEGGPAVLAPLEDDADELVRRTAGWWSGWAARSSYEGPYRAEVVRSLLVLKLLSFAPTGALVAAPTRDERFCSVRDAAVAARVLHDLGYADEADAFVRWLLHAVRRARAGPPAHLDVYGGPSRRARGLVQLDTSGEVIDAVASMVRRGMRLDRAAQATVRALGEFVRMHWFQPDHGVWEPRGAPRDHTHSRLLCWAALDRLLELHDRGILGRVKEHELRALRDRVRRDIEQHGWNEKLQSYTSTLGGHSVDASLLLMSAYGFAQAGDERLRSTYDCIRRRLHAGPGQLLRHEESRHAGEGAYGLCGFWAAKYLADGGGSLDEAEACFARLLGAANDVGLFAEEVAPLSGEALGDFPHALAHLGLIAAALALEERRAREAGDVPALARRVEEPP